MDQQLETLRHHLSHRYELLEEVGRGGMAVVYSANDLRSRTRVAIKVLRPEVTSALAATRFHQEVELARTLDHPNILPLLDSGQAGESTYFVMPLVEGESLATRLRREGQLSVEDAMAIAGQVADGLSYAHELGVLHRDVKPANILLEDGHAVLADFGVARALDVASGGQLTASGMIVGTPGYMSPEQGTGARDLDARSDVYSLGCVLYEMLAGEPPFSGPTAQAVIAKHLREKVPSVDVVRPDLPDPVVYTVYRALAKSRADRFQTAFDLKTALVSDTAPRWRRKERVPERSAWAYGVLAVLVLVTVAFVGHFLGWWEGAGPLNSNLVSIFPLIPIGDSNLPDEIGELVALGIASELERGDPLRPIDGYNWLSSEERADPARVTPQKADSIGRAQGGRYRINGSLAVRGAEATVALTLFDIAQGREIDRRSEVSAATTEEVLQAGYRAVNALLPTLLGADRPFEAPSLQERSPAAAALFTFGNREYRSSRFENALEFYERALAEDSLLVQAAIRGADAASWLDRVERAQALIRVALGRPDLMASWELDFAEGLNCYLSGSADSALVRLRRVTESHPERPDGWFLLGEVYRHLLPRGPDSDRLRTDAYESSLEADPDFTPSLFHLVESALWDGDLEAAEARFSDLVGAAAQEDRVWQLDLMLRCARGAVDRQGWARAAVESEMMALDAAYSLLPSAAYGACAKQGFEAVMASEDAGRVTRIDGILGLQSMLLAEGKNDSVRAVLQTAISLGISYAYGYYVIDALLGGGTEEEASQFLGRFGPDLSSRGPQTLWLMGEWASFNGDLSTLEEIVGLLEDAAQEQERVAAEAGDPSDNLARRRRLFADAMTAHLAALRGDRQEALALLRDLRPNATRPNIAWSLWESLGFERLLEAELLLADGRPEEAIAVASELDSAAPVIYRALKNPSLELRARAAEARGDAKAAERYRSLVAVHLNEGGTP